MTISNNNLSINSEQPCCTHDNSSNWDPLYSSQIWKNSNLRKAIINAPLAEKRGIKYCYTCRGKIRNYQLKSSKSNFVPPEHSTPKENLLFKLKESYRRESDVQYLDLTDTQISVSHQEMPSTSIEVSRINMPQPIPTISGQVDSSFRNKYISREYIRRSYNGGRRRLRKSFKGLRCIVNFALNDSPKKKQTKIQACSISVMIVAIVVISLILVNIASPHLMSTTNSTSTNVVPTKDIMINETTLAIFNVSPVPTSKTTEIDIMEYTTTEINLPSTSSNYSFVNNVIAQIRNNIRTYMKNYSNNEEVKKANISNRDLTQKFCSCQTNEICMLNETSGTSICKTAVDLDDPTGCGGLCALETEACHPVDREHGAYVCRQINPVTCSPNHWRCRNGLCVPSEARCDGFIQCYDRSDELNCECDLKSHFKCGQSLSCFPNAKICDGFVDCWDGFDEVNCTQVCPKTQFTCNDGQCIPSARFCDGVMDCDDGSDEPSGCDSCGAHEFRCNNKRCISLSLRCNGRNDCEDNTDEINCS